MMNAVDSGSYSTELDLRSKTWFSFGSATSDLVLTIGPFSSASLKKFKILNLTQNDTVMLSPVLINIYNTMSLVHAQGKNNNKNKTPHKLKTKM